MTNNPTAQPAGEGGAPDDELFRTAKRVLRWLYATMNPKLADKSILHLTQFDVHAELERAILNAHAARATQPATGPSESPILAFHTWLERWVADNGRKLNQDEYGIAYAAFIAAHPGEGPKAHTMNASSPLTPEEQDLVIGVIPLQALPDSSDVRDRARRATRRIVNALPYEVAQHVNRGLLADIIAAEFGSGGEGRSS
jgi:hypothetical protein